MGSYESRFYFGDAVTERAKEVYEARKCYAYTAILFSIAFIILCLMGVENGDRSEPNSFVEENNSSREIIEDPLDL